MPAASCSSASKRATSRRGFGTQFTPCRGADIPVGPLSPLSSVPEADKNVRAPACEKPRTEAASSQETGEPPWMLLKSSLPLPDPFSRDQSHRMAQVPKCVGPGLVRVPGRQRLLVTSSSAPVFVFITAHRPDRPQRHHSQCGPSLQVPSQSTTCIGTARPQAEPAKSALPPLGQH
jgi:hypothetical protein